MFECKNGNKEEHLDNFHFPSVWVRSVIVCVLICVCVCVCVCVCAEPSGPLPA